jgi:hypothetical protein
MNICNSCSLQYDAGGKYGCCCGHCHSKRWHGKWCTARVTCNGCNIQVELRKCKYKQPPYYCCGHCQGSKKQHGRGCSLFARAPTSNPERAASGQARSRSRTPRSDVGEASVPNALTAHVCKVCLAETRTHACTPCGHFCLCQGCSVLLRDATCPLCRSFVSHFQQIFPS